MYVFVPFSSFSTVAFILLAKHIKLLISLRGKKTWPKKGAYQNCKRLLQSFMEVLTAERCW